MVRALLTPALSNLPDFLESPPSTCVSSHVPPSFQHWVFHSRLIPRRGRDSPLGRLAIQPLGIVQGGDGHYDSVSFRGSQISNVLLIVHMFIFITHAHTHTHSASQEQMFSKSSSNSLKKNSFHLLEEE